MNEPARLMYRTWYRNKRLLLKLLSVSAATAITIRFFYSDNFAAASIRNELGLTSSGSDKLIGVQMFSRHGARTPLHLIKGLNEAEYKSDLLQPYIRAQYKLKTLDNQDFDDIISFYDQKNFDHKLRGGAGRGQVFRNKHLLLN